MKAGAGINRRDGEGRDEFGVFLYTGRRQYGNHTLYCKWCVVGGVRPSMAIILYIIGSGKVRGSMAMILYIVSGGGSVMQYVNDNLYCKWWGQ